MPLRISSARAGPAPPVVPGLPEPKLDLLVNDVPARDVFLAIVANTRYSMLMHPDVAGSLSVTLRGVTVLETLEAIRDVYGYDFKMLGRCSTVYASTMQTRIFPVHYPYADRTLSLILLRRCRRTRPRSSPSSHNRSRKTSRHLSR